MSRLEGFGVQEREVVMVQIEVRGEVHIHHSSGG